MVISFDFMGDVIEIGLSFSDIFLKFEVLKNSSTKKQLKTM